MYTPKTFNIPKLVGISEKTIAEHIKLYEGYVKNTNGIIEKINELAVDSEKNAYLLGEVQRRFGFEFGGMRNHEYYFGSLENGPKEISKESGLYKSIESEYDSFEKWLTRFKAIALTRGIGWAMLYRDTKTNRLLSTWIDEQHIGHLAGCEIILALDMWEHSFVADYMPSGKKQYVEDFFSNLNWDFVTENYKV